MRASRLAAVDLDLRIRDEDEYRERLKALQSELRDLQTACYHNGHQVVIVFEGWDASGKGGTIRRLGEKLDPRSCRVHPIAEPDERERREHYLQRFWTRLPRRGEIAVFDRSWYGRVLVERVEQLVEEPTWQRAYDEINQFEAMLANAGVVVVKLFMHISREEQLRRFVERLDNPRKHWKLTDSDLRARELGEDYRRACEDMFARTHTDAAPWHLVAAEHKWYGRLQALAIIAERVGRGIDPRIPTFSPERIRAAKIRLGLPDPERNDH